MGHLGYSSIVGNKEHSEYVLRFKNNMGDTGERISALLPN